ncbi:MULTISPECIES: SDR family NAD(P)-dependent oxidoreductase [unclassified Bacillus (in: firmicutes)]|uniref:SDR family oxidoreductase n=1 Tax=unclassified Bacillus (in: firmicutes) TaxID=185979 RepID=UPI001BE84997|nr:MULTISPECIES: SDR family NAD(P)-dependent oxidoreductase [unclassified Bacillus (in: firmicutes)]MBT2640531.1 SDR family oxidoreductase [Bacillus sp. ISL-39]MBT2663458.1 SDR family oxidoreductase [Bacillus sp. ISL-45]
MSQLDGKVAFITGASSGIGKAAAIKLAKEGAKVALIDVKEENARDVKESIEEAGGNAQIVECDIANPEEMERSYQKVVDTWGKVDIVFANAGINGVIAPIEDLAPEDWDETINTNLKGTFLTVKYAIPHMKKHGGSVIITSSINGNRIYKNFGMSAYSTSKIGQTGFGKMAALELSQFKIRVNIICPGAIETNIGKNTFPQEDDLEKIKIPVEYPEGNQPLEEHAGKPEQVADLVFFLASDLSSHITGTEVYIDGAESLL